MHYRIVWVFFAQKRLKNYLYISYGITKLLRIGSSVWLTFLEINQDDWYINYHFFSFPTVFCKNESVLFSRCLYKEGFRMDKLKIMCKQQKQNKKNKQFSSPTHSWELSMKFYLIYSLIFKECQIL